MITWFQNPLLLGFSTHHRHLSRHRLSASLRLQLSDALYNTPQISASSPLCPLSFPSIPSPSHPPQDLNPLPLVAIIANCAAWLIYGCINADPYVITANVSDSGIKKAATGRRAPSAVCQPAAAPHYHSIRPCRITAASSTDEYGTCGIMPPGAPTQ